MVSSHRVCYHIWYIHQSTTYLNEVVMEKDVNYKDFCEWATTHEWFLLFQNINGSNGYTHYVWLAPTGRLITLWVDGWDIVSVDEGRLV